jgi:ATP-dependent DNA helicase RecG
MVSTVKAIAEPQLRALKRALMFERKARCTDFRGQHSTFSKFMEKSADELSRAHPLDARWSTLKGLFRNYAALDLSTRINVLHRAEEIIDAASGAVVSPPFNEDKAGDKTKTIRRTAKSETEAGVAEKKIKQYKSLEEIPVQYLKGVGPKVAELFNNLEIHTAQDLLKHYPRRHLDFQNRLMIKQLRAGQEATIFGTIRSVGAFQSRTGNVSILNISIGDGTGTVGVTRFIGGRSNKYLLERYRNQYPKNAPVIVSGTVEVDRFKHRLQMKNAEIELLGTPGNYDAWPGDPVDGPNEHFDSLHTGRLVPVYRLTEGLSLRQLREVIHYTIEEFGYLLEDPVPQRIKQDYLLCDLKTAVREIHFPTDPKSKEEAQHRLVFDELFMVQLRFAQRRYLEDKEESGLALNLHAGDLVDRFRKLLPFSLTKAQERIFLEIAADLSSAKPMQRLVQGDVGSGKTVVAIMSMLVAIQNGYQCAMMAPTEILAEQHYREMQKYIPSLGLKAALLLGKQGTKERKHVYSELLNGQVHIAVGTHALIQEDVEFLKLGLVIIDEQHRFGVKQRAKLRSKGANPQLLTMTATPIPRTLALSLHGDLDISEIDELPPGRKPVKTGLFTVSQAHKRQIWAFMREEIKKGRQAYIVFPLIDESETLSAKAAAAEYEKLVAGEFKDLKVGLMHGRLKNEEKEDVMQRFRNGELNILVCTTVIEVGVDVPNASIMVIENADRFGLSQLHQLRGRVGRGAEQSYCFLIADLKAETTRQRLEIMTQTNDGFVVAQKDLELRGPGEFLGTRQSGLSDLFLADIVRDAKILEDARHAAIDLMKEDPSLGKYPELARLIQAHESQETTDLMSSG